ncbi:MAG: hypothetical protein ACLFTT_13390 [Candidatus Hydrogenedentota bacterium]
MQLLKPAQVAHEKAERIYRDASWRSLGLGALVMIGLLLLGLLPKNGGPGLNGALLGFTGVVAVFFVALFGYRYWQARRPSNWLLIQTEAGLYVNIRHFRSPPSSEEDATVVFIAAEEIAAVGKTHECRRLPDHRHNRMQYYSFIDLYLRHENTQALRQALRVDRRRLVFGEDVFCPVRIPAPGVVHLLWDGVYPGENEAIEELGERYPLAPDRTVEYADWHRLPDAKKQQVIDDLWETGHVREAMRLHRMHHGKGQRAAKAHFAALANESGGTRGLAGAPYG